MSMTDFFKLSRVQEMTFPDRYLDWIGFLIGKKLYGAWIKDVSIFVESCELRVRQRQLCGERQLPLVSLSFPQKNRKAFTVNKNNRYMRCFIESFGANDDRAKRSISFWYQSLRDSFHYGFEPTKVKWIQVYEEFYDLRRPKISLSKKLSRKMYRATNKVRSAKYHYREKEEQPWYDKNYEKYNKKTWRK